MYGNLLYLVVGKKKNHDATNISETAVIFFTVMENNLYPTTGRFEYYVKKAS